MTLTEQINDITDRLDAEESRDIYDLALILKRAIENTDTAMMQVDIDLRRLERRLKELESE